MRLPHSPTLAIGLAALALSGAAPAFAATLYVPLDRSVRVNVPGSAASVVIGNPAVADVTVIDSHTLFVSGHGYGATDLMVLDAAGRMLLSTNLMVAPADAGHVSVYRGPNRTDLACSPGCQTSTRVGQAAVGVGVSAPASPVTGPQELGPLTNGFSAGVGPGRGGAPG